jgi:NADH-quinone oxidoreductase subunit G
MGGLMLGYAMTAASRRSGGQAQAGLLRWRGRSGFRPFADSFKVYIGHHGDNAGAHAADVILPGAAYSEKAGTYVNTEGRVQFAERPCSRRAMRARTGRSFRALGRCAGRFGGFDSFEELRAAMAKAVPALGVEGLADYGGRSPSGGSGLDGEDRRLSDQGFLPDQRHLPRQPDDAALLGRTAAWRRIAEAAE